MANNTNQIKATIEANLAKVRAAYLAELAANPTTEGAATARANYAAALISAQLNAQTLIDNQVPFTEAEYQTTNAILELGYSLNNASALPFPIPSRASISKIHGLPEKGTVSIAGIECKILTEYNTNLTLLEINSSLRSLSGNDYSNFLKNTLVEGISLGKTLEVTSDVTGAGQTSDGGGTANECFAPLEPCNCAFTGPAPKGPNGEIIGDDGEVYLPFDPITNPFGYISEHWECNKRHTRTVERQCDGETGSTIIEDLPWDLGREDRETDYEIPGYEPKPYYNPDIPRDPNNPNIGRYQGPKIIGTSHDVRTKACTFTVEDPVAGKCRISVYEKYYCDSVYILEFSNWSMKPCSFTPSWTDGPPPEGWCDAIRRYIRENPQLPICLPPECKNTTYTGDDGTIYIPIAE